MKFFNVSLTKPKTSKRSITSNYTPHWWGWNKLINASVSNSFPMKIKWCFPPFFKITWRNNILKCRGGINEMHNGFRKQKSQIRKKEERKYGMPRFLEEKVLEWNVVYEWIFFQPIFASAISISPIHPCILRID